MSHRKALPFFISLLFLLIPLVEAQESKVSVAEAEDYRDIGITEKGFEVKDPYALPIYEPRSTSLLPFHDKISFILNSYLGSILSTFDVKEAFALRILFEDLEPILSFIGDLLSIPITLLALPFLSIGRMIKAPLDIIQFLLSAILEPILSIPEDEIAIIERFAESFKDLFHLPSSLLKPIEFLVYNPDPFSGSFSLPSFSASAAKICRAIDFIPVLNIVKGFLTAYLLPLMKALTLPSLSLFSPYRDLLNAAFFPFSLSFILVRGIGSLIKDLLSLLCMPLLFLLRAPLTPLLILFNFLKHSLEGLKEFLRFSSLLVPAFPLLLFLSFILSVLISLLFSSGVLLISLALSIAVTLSLSALFSAIAFFSVFLGGLILASLTAVAACLISIIAGALTGLVLGAAAGLLAGGIIGAVIGAVAGLIIGAVIGVVAAGALGLLILLSSSIAILPLAISIFVALLPTVWGSLVSALGGSGAALIVGIITAVVMLAAGAVIGFIIGGPLGALIGGAIGLLLGIIIGAASGVIIGAAAGLILGIISAFLLGAAAILLTILFALLIALIAGTAGLLIGSLPSFALMAAALLSSLLLLPFSTLALSAIFSGISLLLLLAPALISIISPEIFRIIVPPEILEIAKRIALLPRDAARVISGMLHLPIDLMRAIAVLDDTTEISGEVITYDQWWQEGSTSEEPIAATIETTATTNTTTNTTTANATTATTEEVDGTEPEAEVKEGVEVEEPEEQAPKLEAPPAPLNTTRVEDLETYETIENAVIETFIGATDIAFSKNIAELYKKSADWIYDTGKKTFEILGSTPDRFFLMDYYAGSTGKDPYPSNPTIGEMMEAEKKVGNPYQKDINEMIDKRERMIKMLEKGESEGLTEQDVWELYNLTNEAIDLEKRMVKGLDRATNAPRQTLGGFFVEGNRNKELIDAGQEDLRNIQNDIEKLEAFKGRLQKDFPYLPQPEKPAGEMVGYDEWWRA